MRNDKLEWIINDETIKTYPIVPYHHDVIEFLDHFASQLRAQASKEGYTDLSALAFWCRKGNILKMKENASYLKNYLGRGLIFHITPSNVPINFAYSYFFGLLSGNANIVRIPSKDYPQIKIICDIFKQLFNEEKYQMINERTAFIKYGHDKEITDRLSYKADGRIIWGGDQTIEEIRKSPMRSKGVEIVFADRYSFGLINSDKLLQATDKEYQQLAKNFYNDTYLMDQNACSTPHLICWTGSQIEKVKLKFWEFVFKEAQRYHLEPIKAVDKYTDLCSIGIENQDLVQKVLRWDNLLYILSLKELPQDITKLRGKFGMFFEYELKDINKLTPYITERVQSLLYYGVEKEQLLQWVIDKHLVGIDRIVPFGQALNMHVYWDGYDIIEQLSRKIVFE